ncbi:MAG: hypothetical protein F9B45_15890 [Phycisphaera sp. RhM]|nr:hypothetical protein [Phycisphaera sp. RhM]
MCDPSRTSVMYGIRPSSSGVDANSPKPWTVDALKPHVTLPRHFAASGYRTYNHGQEPPRILACRVHRAALGVACPRR